MAALRVSSAKPHRTYWGFANALASAVLEWLLILFLFVNAIFSFLVTKFARCCKLQTPCLLCSRLDHVFGSKKQGYYWELICGNHKLEISSLVFCHAHNKLVDVHGMCETCLFSFATIDKSNAETYRLLVGKLGEAPACGFDQDPLLEAHKTCCSSARRCSCCSEPWVLRAHPQKLLQTKSVGYEAAELDVPLSGVVGLNQDNQEMEREKPSLLVRAANPRNSGLDSLSHVGYTELKATSDTESEVLYSDDDGASALLHGTDISKDDLAIQGVQLDSQIISLADYSATEKLIIVDSAAEASSSISQVQIDSFQADGGTSVASSEAVKNGLEELSWQQAEIKDSAPSPTEADSRTKSASPTDLISLDYIIPLSDATETIIEEPKESHINRTVEGGQTSLAEYGKINDARTTPIFSSEIGQETKPVSIDTAQLASSSLDLGDAYKIAVGSRGRQSSSVLVEQWVGKDNSRVTEDLKLLLSQLSASRGIERPINDKSPRLSVSSDESKTIDAATSIRMQTLQTGNSLEQNQSNLSLDGSTLQKRISLERNESGLSLDGSILQKRISLERNESGLSLDGSMLQKRISLERNESGFSLDGSNVSEIEGESVVDRLKRQIEHDRKHMSVLYKELEEERNASAIAANQAMAMITKLQEEKATLHMEALQCLRLMEEQSEYDTEALQKANDLLTEREKEIQDLEAELDFYRNKFQDESVSEKVVEKTCDVKARDIGMYHSESVCDEDGAIDLRDSVTEKLDICDEVEGTGMPLGVKDTGTMKNPLLEFEDDRLYILKCLKNLEKKLCLFSEKGEYLTNSEYCINEGGDWKSDFKESNFNGGTQENGAVEEDDLSMQNDISVSRANPPAEASFEKSQPICKENIKFEGNGQGSPGLHRGTDLASLRNEILDLERRLEALEADQTFLEHTINSVRNGEEGLQLVREIASRLQELRMIGIRRMDNHISSIHVK